MLAGLIITTMFISIITASLASVSLQGRSDLRGVKVILERLLPVTNGTFVACKNIRIRRKERYARGRIEGVCYTRCYLTKRQFYLIGLPLFFRSLL